jgi:hypothetical protein
MKRLLILFSVVLSCTTVFAWGPPDYTLTTNTDTRSVILSTITSTAISTGTQATQLLTRDMVQKTVIYFQPSIRPIVLSTGTTFNNLSTMFELPPSTGGPWQQFSPDGVDSSWAGNLYAIVDGSGTVTASVFRTK